MLGHDPLSTQPLSSISEASASAGSVPREPLVTCVERKRSAGFVDIGQSLLLTTLAVVVTVAPFNQTDWQSPVKRVAAQQIDAPRNTALLAQSPAPFKSQVFEYQGKRVVFQTDQPENPLLNTLVPNVAPVKPVDFGNPKANPRAPLAADYHRPSFDPGAPVVPPEVLPFANYDWKNPVTIRGNLDYHALTLATYGQPAPIVPSALPDPVRKSVTNQGHVYSATIGLPPAVTVAPFIPASLNDGLRRAPVQHEVGRNNTLGLPPAVTAAPFTPLSLLDSIRQKVAQHEPGLNNTIGLPPAVVPAAPFTQLDWQNPVRVYKYVNATVYNRPAFDPGPPVTEPSGPPFYQTDWQNPTTLRDRLGAMAFAANAFGPAAPGWQGDWPNPVRKVYDPSPYVVPQNGSLLAPVAQPLPYNITDWPNPVIAIRQVKDVSHFQNPDWIPPYVEPPVVETTRRGGGYKKHRKAHYEERLPSQYKRLEEMVDDVSAEMAFKEIEATAPADVKQQAKSILRPFTPAKSLVKADTVDWAAVEADATKIGALLALWAAERRRLELADDDEEWMMWE